MNAASYEHGAIPRRPGRVPESVATLPPESLVLDVTRLLSTRSRHTPTGIERVEMAYAEALIDRFGPRPGFVRRVLDGLVMVPSAPFVRFVTATRNVWQATSPGGFMTSALARSDRMLMSRAACIAQGANWKQDWARLTRTVPLRYLLVSHANLHVPGIIRRLKRHQDIRLVCMLHDLIPYTHPEFSHPREPKRHERRLRTLAREADLVITNSQVTRDAFQEFCKSEERRWPRIEAVPLGVDMRSIGSSPSAMGRAPWASEPYFVVVGTIEPRKNHLLLLNVWNRLVQMLGQDAPHLIVIGRRGWENENVLDILNRSKTFQGKLHEFNAVKDGDLWSILRGARALLFPSFAEGYGLPLIESLSVGTPVICSDIPVFREIGGDIPCYIDPLDAVGWLNRILQFRDEYGTERLERIARGRNWQPPRWSDHFARVWQFLEEL